MQTLLQDLADGARELGLRDFAADLDGLVKAERRGNRGRGGRWISPESDGPLVRRILRAVDTRS